MPMAPGASGVALAPAAPSAAAPAPPPPLDAQIHVAVTDRLDQLQQGGRIEAQLNLHPPELGRVQLHVAMEDGRVNIRMVVQNENARQALGEQSEPLRVRFAQMGVGVGQFDVRREGQSGQGERYSAEPSAQAQQSANPQPSGPRNSYSRVANPDALVDLIA